MEKSARAFAARLAGKKLLAKAIGKAVSGLLKIFGLSTGVAKNEQGFLL